MSIRWKHLAAILLLALYSLGCTTTQDQQRSTSIGHPTSTTEMTTESFAACARLTTATYDPRTICAATAALHPMDHDTFFAALAHYLHQHPEHASSIGLFALLRARFSLPQGTPHPIPALGAPSLPPPAQQATLQAYPFMWVDGHLFLLVEAYTLGGLPATVQQEIPFYQAQGQPNPIRTCPPPQWATLQHSFLHQWSQAYSAPPTPATLRFIQAQAQP